MTYDKIILGAGLHGLYAAQKCGAAGAAGAGAGKRPGPFMRATYINQARVHMGYHYPRSYSTATKSAGYFERFCRDYEFCLLQEFDQVYATSAHFFLDKRRRVPALLCGGGHPVRRRGPGKILPARPMRRRVFDHRVHLRRPGAQGVFLKEIAALPRVEVRYSRRPEKIERVGGAWRVTGGGLCGGALFAERHLCGRERGARHAGL